jgi:translation initiation factor IF-2
MKIRINDLARELEVKSKVILDILPEVGVIEKKTYSSSIKEYEAERVRKHFSARSGSSSREKTSSLGSKPKIDLSKISKPGDVARLLREREEESRRNLAAQRGAQ